MDGKEAIISDIIAKAESGARALIADAEAERDEHLDSVRREFAVKRESEIAAAKERAENLIARRKTLGELDARKCELSAKQQVIDKAFDEAVRKLHNMTDHIYREFIEGFIAKYAENGDRVVICERDAGRISADWVENTGKKYGLDLCLDKKMRKGEGGIVLSGRMCDKNFTFETLLAQVRDTSLGQITKRLFK